MVTKDITYQIDGKTFTGYLADGSRDQPAPGILVIHQGLGLGDHTRERARMLAELGYVAFAADMFGEVATSREHATALITGVSGNPPLLRQRARAGLDVLTAHAKTDNRRLAAIGFCFGGAVVLELARVHPELACVVAFHPGLTQLPETDERKITGKVMVCAGVQDPLISPAARDRLINLLTTANADWQLLIYGKAGHSFTDRTVGQFNMPGFFHDEPTDKRSWAAMRHLFEESFGPSDHRS
jgi:dienelactone hydrolase